VGDGSLPALPRPGCAARLRRKYSALSPCSTFRRRIRFPDIAGTEGLSSGRVRHRGAPYDSAAPSTTRTARTAGTAKGCVEVALYREVFGRMSAQAMPRRRTRVSLADVRKETER
jgi:hypothetical protein